jgi:transcriptional regulator with XRE-family HTH domain
MTTVDRVKALCKEHNVAISRLERELGFSNGYIGQLRKGTFPDDRLRKIADYFNLSIEDLTGIKKEPTVIADDELSAEFIKLFTQLSPAEREREIAYLRERVAAQDK